MEEKKSPSNDSISLNYGYQIHRIAAFPWTWIPHNLKIGQFPKVYLCLFFWTQFFSHRNVTDDHWGSNQPRGMSWIFFSLISHVCLSLSFNKICNYSVCFYRTYLGYKVVKVSKRFQYSCFPYLPLPKFCLPGLFYILHTIVNVLTRNCSWVPKPLWGVVDRKNPTVKEHG